MSSIYTSHFLYFENQPIYYWKPHTAVEGEIIYPFDDWNQINSILTEENKIRTPRCIGIPLKQ